MFKKENLDEGSIGYLLNALSANIDVEFRDRNSNVFEFNDKGDKFYIILIGKVSILKPTIREYNFDACGYYKQLIRLKSENENYLLNATIALNKSIYPVKAEDLDMIEEIMFKFKLHR